MLASCSLSATINKFSRFMDDSAPANLNFAAAHGPQGRRSLKRNGQTLVSAGKTGKEKKARTASGSSGGAAARAVLPTRRIHPDQIRILPGASRGRPLKRRSPGIRALHYLMQYRR